MKKNISNQFEITLTHLAMVFAVLVFMVFPAVYFFTAYSYESENLQYQADLAADEVGEIVRGLPEPWLRHKQQIQEVLTHYQKNKNNHVQVLDTHGEVVVALRDPIKGFMLKRSAIISAGKIEFGTIEFVMDLSRVANQMTVVFALGMAIAVTVFGVLKTIPLRALNQTMGDLARINKALKQEAQHREQLIAELESKNIELERFTYTVSHDLKSPLITIRGFIGLLEKDAAACDVERVSQDVIQIKAATDQMQQLLDDLLALSRVGRVVNAPQEISLNELVALALTRVAGRYGQKNVEVQVAEDMPVVYGDRTRLLEVLQNLLDNAAKFTSSQRPPRVAISARLEGKEVICCIADNGIGIEPQYQEKIFGLFERLGSESEGTGIGLALVERIVEVHNGRVWVESAGRECGATFCFALPHISS